MDLINSLDRIFFGKENFNRNQISGFKSAGDIESENDYKKKEHEEILRREMERYSHGHLFKIDQVPETIRNEMISRKNLSDWNKDILKKNGMSGKYYLHTKFTGNHHTYDLGLEYVENEHGEPALRLFKEKDSYSHA